MLKMLKNLTDSSFPNTNALAHFLYKKNPQGLSVLCSKTEDLKKLEQDLKNLQTELKVESLLPFECDMLHTRGPTLAVRVKRICYFSELYSPHPNQKQKTIFLCSLDSYLQYQAPKDFWLKNVIHLHKGQEISWPKISQLLNDLGYLPRKEVQSFFECSVRASIIDFYPATSKHPLRIEFLDDRISSIRFFEVEKQRSLDEVDFASITPAREFLFKDLRLNKIKEEIQSIAWPLEDRNSLLDCFKQGIFFNTIDYWASFFHNENNPFYIKDIDFVVTHEASSILAKKAITKWERQLNDAISDLEWVAKTEFFLVKSETALKKLEEQIKKAPSKLERNIKTQGQQLYSSLSFTPSQSVDNKRLFTFLCDFCHKAFNESKNVYLFLNSKSQMDRFQFLLSNQSIKSEEVKNIPRDIASKKKVAHLILGEISEGFYDHELESYFLSENSFFNKNIDLQKKESSRLKTKSFSLQNSLAYLKSGDLLIHKTHGVGRFSGHRVISVENYQQEFIEIEYQKGDKLLVPVSRLQSVQRHNNAEASLSLDKLGGSSWQKKKKSTKAHLQSIAGDLIKLYAQRELAQGPNINPGKEQIALFESSFPFTETIDQKEAIIKVQTAIKGPAPMDHLVCGDVGYGKTEVAMRAIFSALACGYQAAVLAPTTILALQHFNTFKKRFKHFNFEVACLSRFQSAAQNKVTLEKLEAGRIPLVVGTHKLLSSKVKFKKLGLLVVDEEQRFGVTHKEKIKKYKQDIHVLTLTATPIPRTLNLALSGLREISLISTPPKERLSVKTKVLKKNSSIIKEAIEKEITRGGQVYYVHNRVKSISKETEFLKELLPGFRISFVHGQMDENKIEEAMLNFYQGKIQVLVCTSIIESGLDIPNANTLIVDRADQFGLAQLYQIKGRVGRSDKKAYAYLMIPKDRKVSKDAEKRLDVLACYQELGSGFHIASHDLDIRGAGDLLGREQSGQIFSVGFETYSELLKECLAEARGEVLESDIDPEINLPLDSSIPEAYIYDLSLRLSYYRKLASVLQESEVDELAEELEDRFGRYPESIKSLLQIARIKCQLRRLHVLQMKAGKNGVSLQLDDRTPLSINKIVDYVQKYPNLYKLSPSGNFSILISNDPQEAEAFLSNIEKSLSQLELLI